MGGWNERSPPGSPPPVTWKSFSDVHVCVRAVVLPGGNQLKSSGPLFPLPFVTFIFSLFPCGRTESK